MIAYDRPRAAYAVPPMPSTHGRSRATSSAPPLPQATSVSTLRAEHEIDARSLAAAAAVAPRAASALSTVASQYSRRATRAMPHAPPCATIDCPKQLALIACVPHVRQSSRVACDSAVCRPTTKAAASKWRLSKRTTAALKRRKDEGAGAVV